MQILCNKVAYTAVCVTQLFCAAAVKKQCSYARLTSVLDLVRLTKTDTLLFNDKISSPMTTAIL